MTQCLYADEELLTLVHNNSWFNDILFTVLVANHLLPSPLLAVVLLFCEYYYHDLFASRTHTHPFNGPFSGTTQVSRYQKGKINLDFTEARDSEWQWHQLGHMQVCILLQTDNLTSTLPLEFFYRPDALPAAEPTASKHWRQEMHIKSTNNSISSTDNKGQLRTTLSLTDNNSSRSNTEALCCVEICELT